MSNIEWTDQTWNPVVGCTRVSKGCEHCYAERMAKRQIGMGNKNYAGTVDEHGRWTGKVNLIPDVLEKPLHWRKPRRVFACSMSDLFHESVPFEFILQVYGIEALCPHLSFQHLTKRPERRYEFYKYVDREPRWSRGGGSHARYCIEQARKTEWPRHSGIISDGGLPEDIPWPLRNVEEGVSVEDQPTANERIPWLLKTPAAVRWLSIEPMLGPVDLWPWIDHFDGVVVGGESDPGARPMNLDWVRSVRDQCQEAGVKFFFKQMMVGGKKVSLPELDGEQWMELPNA